MLGRWCYRSPYTGLVVGDFEIRREPDGRVVIIEENSRGGQLLSGTLEPAGDGWLEARLQGGNSCRLQLRGMDMLASQFREPGQRWEAEFVSRRMPEHDGTLGGWLQARGLSSPEELSRVRLSVVVPSILFAASGAAYTSLYGPAHGLGLLVLLFVHELGHALMMKVLGVRCGPMVFLPFIGAFVEMKVTPAPAHEGLIALAGPVLGSAAAAVCLACSLLWSSEVLLRLAYWGFLLNALNLLPISFLDGGRVVALLRSELALGGLTLCGLACATMPPSLLLHTFFLAGCYAARPWRQPPPRPVLGAGQQAAFAAAYVGLVGALMAASSSCMWLAARER